MSCNVYINFGGDCRAAVEFYQEVFRLDAPQIMTYGQMPGGGNPQDSDRVLNTMLPIAGSRMMFSDCPSGFPLVKGNNVAVSIGFSDMEEIKRVFAELSQGGEIHFPLEKTFFSEMFGMFTDKFGILWQVSL